MTVLTKINLLFVILNVTIYNVLQSLISII